MLRHGVIRLDDERVNPVLGHGELGSRTVLKRAAPSDSDELSAIWLRSFAVALPSVPTIHTDDEVRVWVRDLLIAEVETWVATIPTATSLGCCHSMRMRSSSSTSTRLGGAEVSEGCASVTPRNAAPNGLGLWTFQVNVRARHLFAGHGFVETVTTDGSRNEERTPDVRMEWRPPG